MYVFKNTDVADESTACNEKVVELEREPEETIRSEEHSNKEQNQQNISENSGQDVEKKANKHSEKDLKNLKKKKSSKKMKNKVRLSYLSCLQKCTSKMNNFEFSQTEF